MFKWQESVILIISSLLSVLWLSSPGVVNLANGQGFNYPQRVCTAVCGVGYSPSLFLLYTLDIFTMFLLRLML